MQEILSVQGGPDKARGPLTRPLRPFVLFVLSFPLDAAIGLVNGALPRLYLGPTALYFCLLVTGYLHQMDKHNQWVTPPALTPVLFLFNSLPNPLLKEGKIIKKEKREMELMLEV